MELYYIILYFQRTFEVVEYIYTLYNAFETSKKVTPYEIKGREKANKIFLKAIRICSMN